MTTLQKHLVTQYGFESDRDGDAECTCGWTAEDDLMGTRAMAHAHIKNLPYWKSIEDDLERARELLKGLWWSYTLSSGPPGYLIKREQMEEVGAFLGLSLEAEK